MRNYIIAILLLALAIYLHATQLPEYDKQDEIVIDDSYPRTHPFEEFKKDDPK